MGSGMAGVFTIFLIFVYVFQSFYSEHYSKHDHVRKHLHMEVLHLHLNAPSLPRTPSPCRKWPPNAPNQAKIIGAIPDSFPRTPTVNASIDLVS